MAASLIIILWAKSSRARALEIIGPPDESGRRRSAWAGNIKKRGEERDEGASEEGRNARGPIKSKESARGERKNGLEMRARPYLSRPLLFLRSILSPALYIYSYARYMFLRLFSLSSSLSLRPFPRRLCATHSLYARTPRSRRRFHYNIQWFYTHIIDIHYALGSLYGRRREYGVRGVLFEVIMIEFAGARRLLQKDFWQFSANYCNIQFSYVHWIGNIVYEV